MENRTFPIFTKDSLIEKADGSITLRDESDSKNDVILFFSKWKVYVYKLNFLTQKIDAFMSEKKAQDRLQIDEEPIESKLFYEYFGCDYDYRANLKITKDEFEETYLRKLAEPHDSSVWSKLVSKQVVYGKPLDAIPKFV